jgi:signal transduction histidine kinase
MKDDGKTKKKRLEELGVNQGLEALGTVPNMVRGCLQQLQSSVRDLQSPDLGSGSLSDAIRRELHRLGEQGSKPP